MNKALLFIALTGLVFFSACKKQSEQLSLIPVADYSPLIVGKYITYRLDSLVKNPANPFGTSQVVHTYQVKYEVDGAIKDNLNRPAFRIIRYIRFNAAGSWVPDNTFMSVNTGHSLEFTENNMRFIKLIQPIKNGYSWKGNRYVETSSINSEVKYLADWNYSYESINTSLTLGSNTFANTLTVNQRDETIGNPDDPGSYSEINYSVESYAKGIGLIYRKFEHKEYQPSTSGGSGTYSDGTYGITLTIIDHN